MWFFGSSHSRISEIQTFLHPYNCVFISQCRYISSAASALSSYSDQIARGKTATQAAFSSPLALLDYPRTWQETAQRSLISTLTVGSFCSVWMALLELVGFPSHWKIPRFFFLANMVVPLSNVCLLRMWLRKWGLQTSGPIVPGKRKLLSVMEFHHVSGRHLKVPDHLSLFK